MFVEYAKASPEDILIRITVHNRGPERAELQVLPTIWFRNTWSWGVVPTDRPSLTLADGCEAVVASHRTLGERTLSADGEPTWLFTENETNHERFALTVNRTPYVKDGIDSYIVHGRHEAVNPGKRGTKASARYVVSVDAHASAVIRLRLSDTKSMRDQRLTSHGPFDVAFETIMSERQREADEFYASVIPSSLGKDETNVMRQAMAGMMWSKQFYNFDVDAWLAERGSEPFNRKGRETPRNDHWHHMNNSDIISMPDKWEYPWYAAWDLAFHVLALTLVDPDFGKQQLDLMLRDRYLHPNGQIPAYEWNFGDVNPPVHAWSTLFTYRLEKRQHGHGDIDWLERSFLKLLLNFTWWVNRKDRSGNNVFEGGFLGLDNIGVFDRSLPLPTGGHLEQADGTAWMALFCQNMLEICSELALERPSYADMCLKFIEHYLWIASSMVHAGENVGMWDEEDGFFYDVLRLPDGRASRLKVRSMVGLLPFCAVTVFEGETLKKYPEMVPRLRQFLAARPELTAFIQNPSKRGEHGRLLASILNEDKLRRVLERMLDENEFLSPHGIRSLSRYHEKHPYVLNVKEQDTACPICRRNPTAGCSVATRTGVAPSGCR